MVDSEKRFNTLAVIGPFAAAIVVGAILYALYPDMGTSSYSDNSGSSSGTTTQYDGTTTGGNNTASQGSGAGTPKPPSVPGY